VNEHAVVELAASEDDFSGAFATVRRTITDSGGIRLVDFVRRLTPAYSRVYRDLARGFAGLAASVVLAVVLEARGVPSTAVAVAGALLIGFWFFYLVSFIHEGLHWNLAPARRANDLLTGGMLACMLGLSLDARRRQHFEHHRSLGTVRDTEMMYFFPLNLVAIAKSATGFGAVRALMAYVQRAARRNAAAKQVAVSRPETSVYVAVAVGAATHASVISSLWWLGSPATSVAWALAVFSVMPILNTIRQLLEHRHPHASVDADYTKIDQGACTRMFSNGRIDRAFGPAGGHQHLLHHWEAQVSYTRLADLERFLEDTPLRRVIGRRRTTYAGALRSLFVFDSSRRVHS
jgi:fatty acid desaturase